MVLDFPDDQKTVIRLAVCALRGRSIASFLSDYKQQADDSEDGGYTGEKVKKTPAKPNKSNGAKKAKSTGGNSKGKTLAAPA